jgi:hypothetical protein
MKALILQARALNAAGHPSSQSQAVRQALRESARFGRLWPTMFVRRQAARMPGSVATLGMDWVEGAWTTPAAEGGPPVDDTAAEWPWLGPLPAACNVREYRAVWEDLHVVRELVKDLPAEGDDAVAAALKEMLAGRAGRGREDTGDAA